MIQSPFAFWLQGLAIGFGLIVAIGAQNAFVLRQGLRRRYRLPVALVSALGDIVLIALGVGGLGSLIAGRPLLAAGATWGGAAFLIWFGIRSLRSAFHPGSLDVSRQADGPNGVKAAVLTALGFSLLNPHVYVDTVVVLGGIGAQIDAGMARAAFGLGAMTASTLWFFGLTYGAGLLAPLFQRPLAWRILDTAIAAIMWFIAASLIWETMGQVG